jgi:hypothetical protein
MSPKPGRWHVHLVIVATAAAISYAHGRHTTCEINIKRDDWMSEKQVQKKKLMIYTFFRKFTFI